MQHLVFFLGTSFSSRIWLQYSWQGCCRKVKDQSFLLFINGVETAKIQPAVCPLSLNHPPRPPSSFRCVPSDPTTSRQLLSQRTFTCSFFSESLVSSAVRFRSISYFLFFSNDCARRVLLELFSHVYNRYRKSVTCIFVGLLRDYRLMIRGTIFRMETINSCRSKIYIKLEQVARAGNIKNRPLPLFATWIYKSSCIPVYFKARIFCIRSHSFL